MIFVCDKCGEYTLNKICQECRIDTIAVKPAKYSPEDKYGYYRRMAKKDDL